MLREFTDAALALLERHLALRVDPAWADAAVAASVLVLVLLSVVALARGLLARWRKTLARRAARDFEVSAPLAVQQPALPPHVSQPVATPVPVETSVPKAAVEEATPPASAQSTPPRASGDTARGPSPREPVAPPPPQIKAAEPKTAEPPLAEPATLSPQQRKALALAMRDAVLAKIAEGGWFKDGAEPLTYRFNRVSLTRMQFEILLELPSPGGAPRSSHALHITVDGRKKLNLEWSSATADATARLRFLSPGDWTAAITAWNFADNRPPVVTPQPARKRA